MHYDDYEYDADWQSVGQSEYPQRLESDPDAGELGEPLSTVGAARSVVSGQYLLTVQLIVCVLLALSAFVLKSVGGEAYRAVREWYYRQVNSSVISENDRGFDIGRLFGAATADEASDKGR